METSLIQTRIDTNLKNDVSKLFDSLGLDMSTAIKIFFKKCLSEGGIPFEVKLSQPAYKSPEGMRAFMALRQEAEANGLSDMTLDEINAEIAAARAERKKKAGE